MTEERSRAHVNRLIGEKSPYLLQHARNPVDWYPWGQEAFEKARAERKPIFLSIGYSTCHWCHVMEEESFEDEEVAGLLNRDFVAIKVDREERPDIDRVYMEAGLAMTGRGGWPLTIVMTPAGKPFFAGTYFPKTARWGSPGLVDLLTTLAEKWKSDPDKVVRMGEEIATALRNGPPKKAGVPLTGEALRGAFDRLRAGFDRTHGGFGPAPKFPSAHNISFLLRYGKAAGEKEALEMAEKTLDAMARGGIYDQLGFGFHRYSVDAEWRVPHFEKMLYDQAMLAIAYIEAYQATGRPAYARVAREIFEYVLRDMTSADGAFYSAEDADSEREEGKYYVWTPAEIKAALGDGEGEFICRYFGVTEGGNFEGGRSVLRIHESAGEFARREKLPLPGVERLLVSARERLLEVRGKRVRPHRDDKVLTDWNGLMIAALAKGAVVLDDQAYAKAAERAADFILKKMRRPDGVLLHRFRDGEAAVPAYLDDYAFLAWGLLELYETTFEPRYLRESLALTDRMIELFGDKDNGGFFFSGKGNEELIIRSKDAYDGAYPSGNSVAALNLVRLGRMAARPDLEERATGIMREFAPAVRDNPAAHTHLLSALQFVLAPGREIVIAGAPANSDTARMIEVVRRSFMPDAVVLLRPEGNAGEEMVKLAPYIKDMEPVDGKAAAYVCENYACSLPVTDPEELESLFSGG